jgi:molybdopterin synthase catalytic subunit
LRSFSSEVGVIIRVQQEDFDSVELQRQLAAGRNDIGAIATFIGLVRDLEGDPLQQMTLEHYPGMTEKALEGIAMRASERWQVIELKPADQIVLVMVASAHRGDAFSACEFIMDYLKTEAPFWKKEASGQGEKWVEARKSDRLAQEKWDN